MASASSNSNYHSAQRCQFFLANRCRYGDRCRFAHDQPSSTGRPICKYFLEGRCKHGARCRFEHPEPKRPVDYSQHLPLNNSRTESWSQFHDSSRKNTSNSTFQRKDFQDNNSYSKGFCQNTDRLGQCLSLASGRSCPYWHLDICDVCQKPALHPFDQKEREKHHRFCLKQKEEKHEETLAVERSKDKTCGICLDIVCNNETDPRFGILENCDHVFCLQCIRTWRSASNYEHEVVKACPACRIKSDFITPVKYWPKDSQAKEEAIRSYKQTLQKIHCKHFKRGDGMCPFGSKCFYLHVDKNNQPVQLAPPRRRRRSENYGRTMDELSEMFMVSLLFDNPMDHFLQEWEFLFEDHDDDDDDDDHILFGFDNTDDDEVSNSDDNWPSWI